MIRGRGCFERGETMASRDAAMTWIVVVGLATAVVALSSPAIAALRMCNDTSVDEVNVAIAYARKDRPGTSTGGHTSVTVEGWWGIPAGECKNIHSVRFSDYWV